jgi:hypothetical protein
MTMRNHRSTNGSSSIRRAAATGVVLTLLTACDTDEWLKVSAPSSLPAENVERPEAAALLVNGAIGNFELRARRHDPRDGHHCRRVRRRAARCCAVAVRSA